MLHMPSPMLMVGAAQRTYEEWLAHITARTIHEAVWGSTFSVAPGDSSTIVYQRFYEPPSSLSGFMIGSPWNFSGCGFGYAATGTRVIQHSLPSLTVAEAVRAAGGVVLLGIKWNLSGQQLQATTRNGFTSSSGSPGPAGDVYDVVEASYWNPITGAPQTTNPSTRSGPAAYSHPDWNS